MNSIAFVISIVCVRPAPWSGRSEAMRYFPPLFLIAEQLDAGSGLAPERAIAPLTVAVSTTTPSNATSAEPAMMRFFTRPPDVGGDARKSIENPVGRRNPRPRCRLSRPVCSPELLALGGVGRIVQEGRCGRKDPGPAVQPRLVAKVTK